MDLIDKDMFVIDKEKSIYKHNSTSDKWSHLADSGFPCSSTDQKMQCKIHEDTYIVVPSHKNGVSCTAIFDIRNNKWMELQNDERKAPINGTLDRWYGHGNGKGIVYFGGYEMGKKKRSNEIWMFYDLKHGWKKMDFNLPENVVQNATQTLTIHPDFCK